MKNTPATNKNVSVIDAPIGHTWHSQPVRASLWRLIWFALASSDWSRTHVNPLTSQLYRSNLGGIAFCIDSVLAMTKAGINRLLGLGDCYEVIAAGYQRVVFRRPIRLGTTFCWRFTLLERNPLSGKMWCKLRFEILNAHGGDMFCFGIFKIGFFPVGRTPLGTCLARVPNSLIRTGGIAASVMMILVGSAIYHQITKPTWPQFLASLEPQARNFFLESDAELLVRTQRTGNTNDLKKLGTFESAAEMWGVGP